jgi:CheY-like chemotaxis protein
MSTTSSRNLRKFSTAISMYNKVEVTTFFRRDYESWIHGEAMAENGQECLDLLDSVRPDLIMMDIMMPVMDGREATRRIRNLPEFARLPIVAASASATREDEARSYAAGAYAPFARQLQNLAENYQSKAIVVVALVERYRTGHEGMQIENPPV